ncbi:MAG: hypothetical protein R3B72_20130 [Polyangiaceae bacterium]
MASSEPLTPEEQKARRRRMLLYGLAVVLLIPTLAIVIVNRIPTEVPPPLWTPDELPAPAEADNGWTLIAHYHSTTISGIDLDPIDKLLHAVRKDEKVPNLTRLWSPARVVASKITEHTKLCTEAFSRKRLVIPCLSLEPDACTTEPVEICTRLVTFAALDQAWGGSPAGAALLATVLERLTDVASNSPHPWMQARTLVRLRDAVHHAGALIKWHRGNASAVRAALEALGPDALPVEHIVIANYLLKHMAIREALAHTDTWLLDEGSIMRGLNAPFEVAKQGGALPPPAVHTEGAFWWFENPIGKKMLDAMKPGADEDYGKTLELRESVLKRRGEALALK